MSTKKNEIREIDFSHRKKKGEILYKTSLVSKTGKNIYPVSNGKCYFKNKAGDVFYSGYAFCYSVWKHRSKEECRKEGDTLVKHQKILSHVKKCWSGDGMFAYVQDNSLKITGYYGRISEQDVDCSERKQTADTFFKGKGDNIREVVCTGISSDFSCVFVLMKDGSVWGMGDNRCKMLSSEDQEFSGEKWIPGVITGCLLFVSVVTVGILFATGVIGGGDEKSPRPSPDLGHTPKEAGLYDSDGKMTRTWEELLTEGMITVEDHSVQHADVMAELSGQLVIGDGITGIGESAFCDCGGLTGITIPDSVISIGGSAFRNCVDLTSITIPDGVTGIGEYAFWNCRGLTGIIIPDSVTSIGECAFSDCRSLKDITIPDSVTGIGGYAFFGCKKLKSITIPDGVVSIGENSLNEIPVVFYNGTASGSPWGAKDVRKH